MGLEGALRVELRLSEGKVAEVAVDSTRRTDAASVFRGWRVEDALRLVPSMFVVCGTAQTVAAVSACEAALGLEVSPGLAQARALLCTLEALDNQAFELGVQWAQCAGRPSDALGVRRMREATAAIRRWLGGDFAAIVPGGGRIVAQGSTREALALIEEAVAHFGPVRAGDEAALREWAAGMLGGAAGALDHFGACDVPFAPDLPAAWYAARFAAPAFCARPSLDGVPAEAGALARVAAHPAVAPLLKSHGRALLTRLVARLVDLQQLQALAARQVQDLHAEEAAAKALSVGSGSGTGVADTARGRLAHQVELEQGRVVGWRAVAPTEWTFHPEGVLRASLLGASASGLQGSLPWLIAALDPCVPCSVGLTGK